VDDGVALVLALRHPRVRVDAITVVRGNAELEQTVRNARLVAETCGVDVPIYAGARGPLVRAAPERPAWIHGSDGFGDLGLRPRQGDADPGFAPDQIVERVMAAAGAITLVTLGPLTNLALALGREPRVAGAVRELVVMGGTSQTSGGMTAVAEFNIDTDPEAARIVLDAGFRLTFVPIELSRGAARFTEDEVSAIRSLGTPASRLAGDLLGHSLRVAARRPMLPGERGAACPDAVAMACAIDRTLLAESVEAQVAIETRAERTTGMTIVDRDGMLSRPPNATVGLSLDAPRFKAMVFERMKDEG